MLLLGTLACVSLFQQRDHLKTDRFIPEYVCDNLQTCVKTPLLFAQGKPELRGILGVSTLARLSFFTLVLICSAPGLRFTT